MNWKPLAVGATAALGLFLLAQVAFGDDGEPVSTEGYGMQYKPESPEAVQLFAQALNIAGLDWAPDDLDMHWILSKESNGWVGKPNYTYGSAITKHPERWPEVWTELINGVHRTSSTATGLGQLLVANVEKFYPDGLRGIGDPLNEAVGFVRYIYDRYGSPKAARSVYGVKGTYYNDRTGTTMTKSFAEGY